MAGAALGCVVAGAALGSVAMVGLDVKHPLHVRLQSTAKKL